MHSLPSVTLGAIILSGFVPVFVLRWGLMQGFVLSAPPIKQVRRQFLLDFIMSPLAGAISATVIAMSYTFVPASAFKLIFGTLTLGFFIALQMALLRERQLIMSNVTVTLDSDTDFIPLTRRFTWVAVASCLLMGGILTIVWIADINWLAILDFTSETQMKEAVVIVAVEISLVMGVLLAAIVALIVLYSGNLKLLFNNQTQALERVSHGNLDTMVPVSTADEFGLIAGHTNHMIDGLRHRSELLSALKVAEDVQQSLLPAGAPEVPGLDIATVSLYCDETGGDYYDFFTLANGDTAVAVGDVSGHGVGPALLMASTRAILRMTGQLSASSSLEDIVSTTNAAVVEDVADSGRFLTLFLLSIAASNAPGRKGQLRWVRAGHDPALLFHPSGRYEDLSGTGIALGVVTNAEFEEGTHEGPEPGSVLVIYTDGVTEAHDGQRNMFGRNRTIETVQQNISRTAQEIATALTEAVEEFRSGHPSDDDVTLVVIKFS